MKELKCSNKTTIFFDLDGTIMNTFQGIKEGFIYAFEKANIDLPDIDFETIIGPPFSESLPKLVKTQEEVELITNLYRENYFESGWKNCELYEGVYDTIVKLNEKGYKIYIATCKPENISRRIARHFGLYDYIIEVFGAGENISDGRQYKEEVLEYALNEVSVEPSECIMIGDSMSDKNGAKHHNMDFGAVLYGFGADKIKSEKNFFNVEKAIEILRYL